MNAQELITKRRALLEETAKFYTTANRCVAEQGGCKYWLPDKPGCAIGRLIKDKELCRKLDNINPKNSGVSNSEVFGLLPDDLQKYGQEFLCGIQNLHDESENWCERGLTNHGQHVVADIWASFNLD